MQKIKAGEIEIEVVSVEGKIATHNGVVVDSFMVSFPNDVTEEQLEALLSNPWELYDEAGNLQGVHVGINFIESYRANFLRIPDAAKLQARLQAASTETVTLRASLADASAKLQTAESSAAMYKAALQYAGINTDPEYIRDLLDPTGGAEVVPDA